MEAWFVISLLIIGVVLFSLEKISVDLVTLMLLAALVLSGTLTMEQAFAGFSNDVIILLACIFVIGTAMRDTGLLDALGDVLVRMLGGRTTRLTSVLMIGVSAVSAFMNNTTVTAMFLGPVMGVAKQAKIPASRLLMPLAFASILGGTCTLIGTSTNVAVSGYMKKVGLEEVGMFEITPIGLCIVASGLAYMLLIGLRMLPDRGDSADNSLSLREYVAEVVILPGSPIIGQEVIESDFAMLGFQVLKVIRGKRELSEVRHAQLQEADVVLVAGKVEDLIRVKKIEGIDIREDADRRGSDLSLNDAHMAEVVLTPKSSLVGRTLRESQFRQRSGLSVLALLRGDQSLVKQIGEIKLHAGDVLLVQGPPERIRSYEEEAQMVVITKHRHDSGSVSRGWLLLACFASVIVISSVWPKVLPLPVGMLLVAIFSVLSKCISIDTAYENIDWRLLILIGGMTAFGQAMSGSGAAEMLANFVTGSLSSFGPLAVLAGFCFLTLVLTQPMSNAAAALVVLPVAIEAAQQLHLNERTFAIAVMLSASVSMLTPFEPSCILVYGPGKYRFSDFLRVGGGISVVLVAVILLLVPYWWPLAK